MNSPLVLVIDDSAFSTVAIKGLLSSVFEPSSIEQTGDPDAAVRICVEKKPQAVILNYLLRGSSAMALAEKIALEIAGMPILLLNLPHLRRPLENAARARVRGLLLESDPLDLILPAIDALRAKLAYISPAAAALLLDCFRGELKTSGMRGLSAKEAEIVRYVTQGHSNKAIAFDLHLSVKTVEGHRSRITKKLGVNSTAELIRLAIEHGIASAP